MGDVRQVGFGNFQGNENVPANQTRGIGKDDFLKLLLVQLRYQDHESVADFKDLLWQMNQIAQIEQFMNMRETINSLAETIARMTFANSLDLIGKVAWLSGDEILMKNSSPQVKIGFGADIPFQDVRVLIRDSNGNLVREIRVGDVSEGLHSVQWDGKDMRGQTLPDGRYTFEVVGKDASGKDIKLDTFIVGTVDSVSLDGLDVMVEVAGKTGRFYDIVKVER